MLAPDTSALRESRDLRLVVLGNFVSGMGTQATLVALPYQVFVESHSALLVGLLGAVELVPLVASALLGGAMADRMDRRTLLLLDQIGLVLVAGALAAVSFAGDPAIPVLYVLAGLLAGVSALQNVVRSAIVPTLVRPELMRSALALNYGLYQLTMVIGPGLGGVLIAASGLSSVYVIDAVSCLGMAFALVAMAPQPPLHVAEHPPIGRSIVEGLRFVRSENALLGSFAIDLVAMTFGMPRVLFPVLSLSVYHAGASGTGALYAAVSAGATVGALSTGWLSHTRRLGRVVIGAVTVWGGAIALAGTVSTLWPALLLLALAGAADSVSAVCRSTINQLVTPEAMRGRMSSVFSLVVTSGPRFGDIESGAVASLSSARFSVCSGGLACVALAALFVAVFPALVRYDSPPVIAAEPQPEPLGA